VQPSGKPKYTPKARHSPLKDGESDFWGKLYQEGLSSDWLELDLYEYTKTIVESLAGNGDQVIALETLHRIAISGKFTEFLLLLK
jgi:hypothetical protein